MREDHWFRAYVTAIRHDVDRLQCKVTALVETLIEADPELQQKYEDRRLAAEKRLRETSLATDDRSLPEENQKRRKIVRNFRRESEE